MATFKHESFSLYHILCVLLLCSTCALSELSSSQKNSMINLCKNISNSFLQWDVNKEPCSWKGIKCSVDNTSVVNISLSGYSLSSSEFLPGVCEIDTLQGLDVSNNRLSKIPDQFMTQCVRVSGLKRLNFSRNRLVGSLPGFVDFVGLEVLDLSFNNLSGFIPSQLGKSYNLKELILSSNSFRGSIPLDITKYRNLAQIDLSQNSLVGTIPENIGNLSKLEVLVLSANNLSGEIPEDLNNIKTLRRFAANMNNFRGKIPSGITKYLTNFDLSFNKLTGSIPSDLLSAQRLQTLDLTSNDIEGPIPSNISGSLLRLRLGSNSLEGPISFADFSKLQNLTYLELDNNYLTGLIPPELGSCKSLALLSLAQNRLEGALPAELGSLSNLQVLKLQINHLSGEIPMQITQLQNLITLNISWNSLSGPIPPSISSLQRLTNLNLNGNNISGSIPNTISTMESLLELQLGENKLSGGIPRMPNLQIALNLSNNLFEGPIPTTLSMLGALEVLDLSNNNFSGEVPNFLSQLQSLTKLLLSNNSLSGVLPQFRASTEVDIQGNKGLINGTKSDTWSKSRKQNQAAIIVTVVAISAVSVVLVAIAVMILTRRYRRVKDEQLQPMEDIPHPLVIHGNLVTSNALHRSNIDFLKAMESVSIPANIVLKTRFSTYYKAVMPSGFSYLVKKLNWSDKIFQVGSHSRFGAELEVFGRLNNSNIMTPLAYVLSTDTAYLFYEYSSKGTLFDVLHNSSGSDVDWASRYSIAVGVAQGLAFLHGAASGPILLLDLSSKSIFLKSLKEPLVGDIELYKVIDPSKSTGSNSTVAGSVGFIPPEYAYTMRVTMPGNVYSFGVILLELLTGKPAVSEGMELAKWVLSSVAQQDKWDNMLDFSISTTSMATKSQMLAVMKIALGCVSVSPTARPKMKSVLPMLLNAR